MHLHTRTETNAAVKSGMHRAGSQTRLSRAPPAGENAACCRNKIHKNGIPPAEGQHTWNHPIPLHVLGPLTYHLCHLWDAKATYSDLVTVLTDKLQIIFWRIFKNPVCHLHKNPGTRSQGHKVTRPKPCISSITSSQTEAWTSSNFT